MELEGKGKEHDVKITPQKAGGFLASLLVLIGLSFFMGMNNAQLLSLGIVASFVLGTVFFWEFRLSFAFLGMALLLATGTMDVQRLVGSSSLDVILFLMGMMVFIGYLEKYHVLEYVISKAMSGYLKSGRAFFFGFIFLSAISAALVDEVTSILFMVGIAVALSSKLKIDPVPLILCSIFATNIGSAATVIGNPVGVMLALKANLTFSDFFQNATPVAAAALVALSVFLAWHYRKYISEMDRGIKSLSGSAISAGAMPKSFLPRISFFVLIILGLVFHVALEEALGLNKNVLLLGVALFAAGLVIFFERNGAREFFESKVDFWTLSFFLILFASSENLKNLGVTDILAIKMDALLGNDPGFYVIGFTMLTGMLSAALDNVVAVATFIPVVQSLQGTLPAGLNGGEMYWALLFAATFFGNLTIIGSTANIVAASLMEKRGIPIPKFTEWFSIGWKVVAITVTVALAALLLRIGSGP